MQTKKYRLLTILLIALLLSGCTNITPTQPQSPGASLPPAGQPSGSQEYVVTYTYGSSGPVQLSANNLEISVGQRLILQAAPSVTQSTRFTSSGGNFFGDIMQQQTDPQTGNRITFTAIKPGRGKLRVFPAGDESRAADLWVTVK